MSMPALQLATPQAALASASLLSQMRLAVRFMGSQGYAAEGNYAPETALAFMEKVDSSRACALRTAFEEAPKNSDFHPTACNRFQATMRPYFDAQLRALAESNNPLQALRQAGFEASDSYDVFGEAAYAKLISDAGITVFVDRFDPLVKAELECLKTRIEKKYFLHGYANLEKLALSVRVFGVLGGILCAAHFGTALFSAEKINIFAYLFGGTVSMILAIGAAESVIARCLGYAEIVHRSGCGSENDAIRYNQCLALRDTLTIISSTPELKEFFEGER